MGKKFSGGVKWGEKNFKKRGKKKKKKKKLYRSPTATLDNIFFFWETFLLANGDTLAHNKNQYPVAT